MKRLDAKSMLVGIAIAAAVVFGIAAVESGQGNGRYTFSICTGTAPSTFFVCIGDTATGKYAVERGLEQIPATHSVMTYFGIYNNPHTEKHVE